MGMSLSLLAWASLPQLPRVSKLRFRYPALMVSRLLAVSGRGVEGGRAGGVVQWNAVLPSWQPSNRDTNVYASVLSRIQICLSGSSARSEAGNWS